MRLFALVPLVAFVALSASAKPKKKPAAKPLPRSYRLENFAPIETAENSKQASRAPAAAAKPTRPQFDPTVFFDRVGKTMLDCPARIWPNYDWKSFQVVLLRSQRKTSLLWKGRDRSVSEIDNSRLEPKSFDGLYDFFELDQVSTMSVQPEPQPGERAMDALTVFRVAVHEFFHIEGQKSWIVPERQKRGTAYPLEAKARFARFMLFDRLFRYFLDAKHDEKWLGLASHWYKQWVRDFPEEAANNTDIPEGTARYLDLMAAAIADRGCASGDADLYGALVPLSRANLGGSVTTGEFSLSNEGYDLGTIASLVLRMVKKDPAWQELAAKGVSPLASLLKDVSPIAEDGDLNVKAKMERDIGKQNYQIASVVGTQFDGIGRKDVLRVSVASSWMPANFSPMFELLPKAYPDWTAMPMMEMRLKDATTDLKTSPGTVYFDTASPCSASFTLLIPNDKIAKEKNGYRSRDPRIQGLFQADEKKDAAGFTWLCGK